MADAQTPPISIVIPTCNRGAGILDTVRSVLALDYPDYQLLIVDQSKDDQTEVALDRLLEHPRVRYIRTGTRGVAQARNVGAQEAESELLAYTDDDCTFSPDWLHTLVEAFAVDPRVAIVFGNVNPGPYDQSRGFIPSYRISKPYLARSLRDKYAVEGMSACMGMRRTAWQEIGGFDLSLGAGASLKSGAETDLTIRVLEQGFYAYETPKFQVIHHGFRDWDDGQILIERYWFGTGAVFAKQIRTRPLATLYLMTRLGLRWLRGGKSPVAASIGSNSHSLARLGAFTRGFFKALRLPCEKSGSRAVFRSTP